MGALFGCHFPADRHYHVEHNVWVRREANGVATIGATSYGCALAGEFVSFVPKRVGTEIARDQGLGIVELFKVVHAIHSPVSGRIVAVNADAQADPGLIHRDCYDAGWFVQLEPSDWEREVTQLLTGDAALAGFAERMRWDRFEGVVDG